MNQSMLMRTGRAMFMALSVVVLGACFSKQAPQMIFKTITGQTIAPADYQGQVMLVNFWATSCTTCVKEMPGIVDTYNTFKDQGFRTVAVAMSYDRPDYVLNFAETRKLPFDVALDLDGSIAKAYDDVKITPTSYLINRKGEIIKTYVGEPEFQALHGLIQQALAEKP
ncbi:TlpA family protein disulfide reductase [Limnobacter humi]|uniref:TlpA family protein disulfide reductase n=1 Tax=Limnobacter humi TaxID=1778671 RepID=A0ABT1WEF3_9BURK|nr:TlpA disulfide reductase family protein [Limnobacter humi]MCQ8895769.1 TlpA family protein disulfide reductase [Limnobacter humi]